MNSKNLEKIAIFSKCNLNKMQILTGVSWFIISLDALIVTLLFHLILGLFSIVERSISNHHPLQNLTENILIISEKPFSDPIIYSNLPPTSW